MSDTLRKGIIDVEMYNDAEKELILGCLSSLGMYESMPNARTRGVGNVNS